MLAASTTSLKAQFFLGGGLSVNTSSQTLVSGSDTQDGNKSFSYSFSPKAGFFISEKFALGLALDIGSTKYTDQDGDSRKSNYWSLAPFARFYFAKKGDFSFFGEGSVGIGGSKVPNYSYEYYEQYDAKSIDITFRISPAFAYDLTEKIALEAVLGGIGNNISISDMKNSDDKNVQSDWGLALGLDGLSLGMIIKL